MKLTHSKAIEWISDCEKSLAETTWRNTAEEDYRFYAGDQDTVDVKMKLQEQRRPNTVFNEIKPKVDMLIGVAGQSRSEGKVLPVGAEDEPLAELMDGVLRHFRKELRMKQKEQSCFEHVCKSGRSLLYFWINKDNPFRPKPQAKRIPGWQFGIDPDSIEDDLSDARYIYIDKWITEDEYKELKKTDDVSPYSIQYEGMPEYFNQEMKRFRLVELWYKQMEEVIWFINPLTGKEGWLFPNAFGDFEEQLARGVILPNGSLYKQPEDKPIQPVPGKKEIFRYCILDGEGIIEEGLTPYLVNGTDRVGFPCVLYSGYRDDNTNALFGAITMAKDPQRALNTTRRQLVHLLQTLPKGILVSEAGTILNIEEYEQRGSEPNFHLELTNGGMGRYKFETQPSISPVYNVLDQTFGEGIKAVTGIPDEMMGVQQSSREAGISVQLRQQSGLTVIYTLFDKYQNARILGNKKLMALLQQFVSYDTMIRIEGEKGAQLVQVNTQMNPQVQGFNDITAGTYDYVIDEVDESPTQRMEIARILTELNHNNPGMIPPDVILEYANAPYTVKQRVLLAYEQMMAAEEARKDAEAIATVKSAHNSQQASENKSKE